jgi:hypothetical protein
MPALWPTKANRRAGDRRFGGAVFDLDAPARPAGEDLAASSQELHHVVEPEPAITALADAVERELAPISKSLHGVDVQVQQLGDFTRGEHRAQVVHCH